MYTLGINCIYHESSACLVKDGKILSYAEEERINRVKHAKESLINNSEVLPTESIRYCLKTAKITGRDIDKVGLSFSPKKRLQNIKVNEDKIPKGWGTKEGEDLFYKKASSIPKKLKKLLNNNNFHFSWIDHHLCHAASSFLLSPFKESAILVVDGIAEFDTTYLGYTKNNKFIPIRKIKYPNSLGFLWENSRNYR